MVSGKFYNPFELLSPCPARVVCCLAAAFWVDDDDQRRRVPASLDFKSVSCRPTPTSTGFQVCKVVLTQAELSLSSCFMRPFFLFGGFHFWNFIMPSGMKLRDACSSISFFIVLVATGCFIYSKHCLSKWVWRRRLHFTAHKTQVLVFGSTSSKWRRLVVLLFCQTKLPLAKSEPLLLAKHTWLDIAAVLVPHVSV